MHVFQSKQLTQQEDKDVETKEDVDEGELFCDQPSVPCVLQEKDSQALTVREKRREYKMNCYSETNIKEHFCFYA